MEVWTFKASRIWATIALSFNSRTTKVRAYRYLDFRRSMHIMFSIYRSHQALHRKPTRAENSWRRRNYVHRDTADDCYFPRPHDWCQCKYTKLGNSDSRRVFQYTYIIMILFDVIFIGASVESGPYRWVCDALSCSDLLSNASSFIQRHRKGVSLRSTSMKWGKQRTMKLRQEPDPRPISLLLPKV